MSTAGDDDVRALYDQLRADDGGRTSVPEFRRMWNRAESPASAQARTRRRTILTVLSLAVAAGVVLTAGVVLRTPRATPSISDWRSPQQGC